MSEDGFHVHGAHDHAVEHGAQAGDSLASRVAVTTAILSTLGAVLSYQGGATQIEAMLYKNEAVLRKAQASDQWAYYQAKGNKQNLSELAAAIAPTAKQSFYKQEADRYKQEKAEIKKEADKLEEESKKANELSEAAMHPHHRLAQALTLLQVAISLASITVLTRKTWLYWGALASAAGGGAIWLSIFFLH
jgi:hypothetical protein